MTQLETRISGAKLRIEKTNAKIARLNKSIAKKTSMLETETDANEIWSINYDIKNLKEDIARAERDLASDIKKLAEYEAKQKEVTEKESAIVDVPQINEFLESWKQRAKSYYILLRTTRKEVYATKFEINEENLKMCWKYGQRNAGRKYTDEKITEILASIPTIAGYQLDNLQSEVNHQMRKNWDNSNTQSDILVLEKCSTNEELDKMLDKEVYNKKVWLTTQVQEITGKITDCGYLFVGKTGGLEGFIIGENGKANVQTIFAGGYNIQCLHFRTLVNPIK
jgi:hypothetical protein